MLLADNTGSVSGPGQTSSPVYIDRSYFYRALDLLLSGNFPDGAGGTYTPAQGAGILAITLGHDEMRRPESGHAGLC